MEHVLLWQLSLFFLCGIALGEISRAASSSKLDRKRVGGWGGGGGVAEGIHFNSPRPERVTGDSN